MGGVNCLNFVPGIIKKKEREGREREGEREKVCGKRREAVEGKD